MANVVNDSILDFASIDELFYDLAEGQFLDSWTAETDSSNDSFTADCKFLLSTVLNIPGESIFQLPEDVAEVYTTPSQFPSSGTMPTLPLQPCLTHEYSEAQECSPTYLPTLASNITSTEHCQCIYLDTPVAVAAPRPLEEYSEGPGRSRSVGRACKSTIKTTTTIKGICKPKSESKLAKQPFKFGSLNSSLLEEMNQSIEQLAQQLRMNS
ncbi:hypothetical protein CEUSTIGMA_g3025.t1 [Chlamydomonas eustigma]|uniref:Uncharacterized protein n=1 Tax=Chlamydomonas eustigma TaxID=1157962 RepID=A0A250WXN8_9CHLO|nr:hypothetical protein CEUSTIGMA_g3025.t1 [Chlamydomonas eustigma]|eukprot:GAX75581.1 hypothetical protein CEUSTIGMA_g3025.t1 [Chlamydomonas eustigma]